MNAVATVKPAAQTVALVTLSGGFATLPKPVQTDIVRLNLAFPAGRGNLGAEETRLSLENYAEAIDGFPSVVVVGALKHLLLKNPRNPFAPTPQDVNELCNKSFGAWKNAVVDYVRGREWRDPSLFAGAGCPPPWTAGFLLSPETVHGILRKCAKIWKEDLSMTMGGDLYLGNSELRKPSLCVSDERFERIPHDVFEDGERQRIVALRQEAKHQIERELGNLKKRQEAWILDAPQREEKERTARATGERNWAEHLDRSYPIVDGRRTLGPVVRKDYRLDGYTNEMLNNALAELYETESLLQRQIPDAETFRRLVTGSAFKKLLAKQRHADPDSFRPVHY